MPIRAVVILFVAALVFAVFYHEQIYKWLTKTLSGQKDEEDREEPDEEAVKRLSYKVLTVKEKTEDSGGGKVHFLSTSTKKENKD